MKMYLLGVCTVFVLAFVHQLYGSLENKTTEIMLLQNQIFGSYLLYPLVLNRCSEKEAIFKHTGKKHKISVWFGCDKFQRLINIER